MIVVNLFGVPGAGKSTGAAYVFANLKMRGINAELVTEFAKDMVWENNSEAFKNQAYIFGKQSFRISRCQDKVDVIVTDCPILLTAFYNKSPVLGEEFNHVVANVFHSYHNLNFLIDRVKDYNPIGRLQTEQEAQALRAPMLKLLKDNNVDFSMISGDVEGYNYVVEHTADELMKEHRAKHHGKAELQNKRKRTDDLER